MLRPLDFLAAFNLKIPNLPSVSPLEDNATLITRDIRDKIAINRKSMALFRSGISAVPQDEEEASPSFIGSVPEQLASLTDIRSKIANEIRSEYTPIHSFLFRHRRKLHSLSRDHHPGTADEWRFTGEKIHSSWRRFCWRRPQNHP